MFAQVAPTRTRYLSLQFSLTPLNKVPLLLYSLNAVRKESAVVAVVLGRPTPDPGLGAQVELLGGHMGSLLDLLGIGEALPRKPHRGGRGATNLPAC